jgi:hypothetical protein
MIHLPPCANSWSSSLSAYRVPCPRLSWLAEEGKQTVLREEYGLFCRWFQGAGVATGPVAAERVSLSRGTDVSFSFCSFCLVVRGTQRAGRVVLIAGWSI